jgi:hypothetical protein
MKLNILSPADGLYWKKVSVTLFQADGLRWKYLYVSDNYVLLVVIVLLIPGVPLCVTEIESVFVMCKL